MKLKPRRHLRDIKRSEIKHLRRARELRKRWRAISDQDHIGHIKQILEMMTAEDLLTVAKAVAETLEKLQVQLAQATELVAKIEMTPEREPWTSEGLKARMRIREEATRAAETAFPAAFHKAEAEAEMPDPKYSPIRYGPGRLA